MADFVEVPFQRLSEEVLAALLEEFASRDGTDYGHYELTLADKVARLRGQLQDRRLFLLYDGESEQWDLLPREQALELLE
mgnify:CR=1 FL=1|tara:strand:- start:1051 stop:1290 length:240 start_codon:yes stop_codon:yes gene_type:complete